MNFVHIPSPAFVSNTDPRGLVFRETDPENTHIAAMERRTRSDRDLERVFFMTEAR